MGHALTAAGIDFEFGEYLRGETHYIALTVKKRALLAHRVLRADLPQSKLLARSNVVDAELMSFARTIAGIVGLPPSTEFAPFHPAKLFDFSTRGAAVAQAHDLAYP